MSRSEMPKAVAPNTVAPDIVAAGESEAAPLPFERALAELEEIVKQLEGGRVPLEDSIAIYERGEFLKRHCEALLKRAEARIERITLRSDGQPTGTVPLDPA